MGIGVGKGEGTGVGTGVGRGVGFPAVPDEGVADGAFVGRAEGIKVGDGTE